MVGELKAADISDERVLEALGRLPREDFVAEEHRRRSYENTEIPIAGNQTISPPYLVAFMTQLLALRGDEKVLEIGTGSGYQAAILAELVPRGVVYSVEILPVLAGKARERLSRLRERGVLRGGAVHVIEGDGAKGYPAEAPYDAIVVTAAPRDVPEELREQLAPGGRMVIPVGEYSYQELRVIEKSATGAITERAVKPSAFVPMTGAGGEESGGGER